MGIAVRKQVFVIDEEDVARYRNGAVFGVHGRGDIVDFKRLAEPLEVPGGFICWASWMRRLSCPVVGSAADSRRMRVMTLKMISIPSDFFAEVVMNGA